MASINKINLNGVIYDIGATTAAEKSKTMTFAEAGIKVGSTNNIYSNDAISNEINNGVLKFVISPAGLTNNNTIINVVSSAGNGAVYTALYNQYGAGKELTFVFINAAVGASETPYYTVKRERQSRQHTESTEKRIRLKPCCESYVYRHKCHKSASDSNGNVVYWR